MNSKFWHTFFSVAFILGSLVPAFVVFFGFLSFGNHFSEIASNTYPFLGALLIGIAHGIFRKSPPVESFQKSFVLVSGVFCVVLVAFLAIMFSLSPADAMAGAFLGGTMLMLVLYPLGLLMLMVLAMAAYKTHHRFLFLFTLLYFLGVGALPWFL